LDQESGIKSNYEKKKGINIQQSNDATTISMGERAEWRGMMMEERVCMSTREA